ncbi:hypothetical protein RHGRI_026085 [Rhododendron griersonianum]|uniref:Uncharacterized protein n=1 Tax=Rhododendron griersonianum TaxID=479676 RepID=A0AAV6IUY6_9ERIC|nr:hypothetical protein RHGRI_026085 [Rhododendron griersonianum]
MCQLSQLDLIRSAAFFSRASRVLPLSRKRELRIHRIRISRPYLFTSVRHNSFCSLSRVFATQRFHFPELIHGSRLKSTGVFLHLWPSSSRVPPLGPSDLPPSVCSLHSSFSHLAMSRASSSRAPAKPWCRSSESQVGFSYFVSKEASNYCDDVLSKKGQDLIKRNIQIHDFKGFGISEQFEQWGWVDAFLGYDDVYPEMVREFLTNVTNIDLSLGSFTTYARGMRMNFSVNSIRAMLNLPIVDNPQWPLAPSLMPSRCEVLRELTGGVYTVLNLPK